MNRPIDLFSFVHFINFFILSFIIKNNYKIAFLIGIVWEIFEYYFAKNKKAYQFLKQHWPVPEKYWNETHHLNPVLDTLFNMIGYYSGTVLRNLYENNQS